MAEQETAVLAARHITCGYGGAPVVRDVSFSVKKNSTLCILGPNGCGKTTLLRAVAGLLPCEGTVDAAGLRIGTARRADVARTLALMTQTAQFAFDYTVYDTVMMGRYAHQKRGVFAAPDARDRAAVEEALECTGTQALRSRSITALSGGQLQRVLLARTFAQSPQIILLDEPTNHLDLKYQLELVRYVRRWVRQDGRCAVGVLHDLNLALAFADEVLLMQDGRVAAQTPAARFDAAAFSAVYGMDVAAYMRESLARWG